MSFIRKLGIIDPRMTLASIGTGLLGLAYITGYLISAFYLRHRGISPLPLLKAQYVETGISFLLLTLILVGIPFLIIHLMSLNKDSQGKWPSARMLLVMGVVTNYLLVISLVVIFVEKEWTKHATIFGITAKFPHVIVLYLLLTIILLAAPRILLTICPPRWDGQRGGPIRRFVVSICKWIWNHRPVVVSLIILCRILVLLGAVFVDYFVWMVVPWLGCFVSHASIFLYAVVFLIIAIGAVGWFAKGVNDKKTRWKIWIPAFLLTYYLCIMTFSYRIYPNVPVSRGGKYPTSELVINFRPNHSASELLREPLYIIEQTDGLLYAVSVSGCTWYKNDDPILVIPMSDIAWLELARPTHHEPRDRLCSIDEESP